MKGPSSYKQTELYELILNNDSYMYKICFVTQMLQKNDVLLFANYTLYI